MKTTTSPKVLENSIFWQKQVLKQSRDPKQIERCKAAIAKLEQQLKEVTQ
jgi:hypothetical protein